MALSTLLFSQIISNAAPLNPGIGGWDSILDQFMSDFRGRMGFHLLARLIGIDPPQTTGGVTLIAVPTGWSCMPMFVMHKRTEGGANPNRGLEYHVVGDGGEDQRWSIGGTISLTQDEQAQLIFPDGGFGGVVSSPIEIVDGDDPLRNLFAAKAKDGTSTSLDIMVYGMAWQNTD